ncbi:MAG: glutamate-5-semialdehyde dehydrogenase [Spirochaetales bacterium]|nr:glutamate-5-semialdehyde dehydrogenase [Spirochaetales bacterium]
MTSGIYGRFLQVKAMTTALSASSDPDRRALLERIAGGLLADADAIFEANRTDLENAASLPAPVRARLKFSREKLDASIASIREVAALPDPIGRVLYREKLDEGLLLEKISVPIGVIGMVFEARPDALLQIASLCLKSGNCLILKGGSEAINTNRALVESIRRSCAGSFATPGWIELLETHDDVAQMLKAQGVIDLIIPRGSNRFVRYVMENTLIPVLGHADGLCSMYVDAAADTDLAVACALDAKTNYPSACNSIENLLVHRAVAGEFLPKMATAFAAAGVEIRGDEAVQAIIDCKPATDADWDTEYLDLIISIKTVDSTDEAIDFISKHTSHHTDAIITRDPVARAAFMRKVDSASVFANCSTRFADGYRYGLGAEVGISTSKIHARGPVGLEGLMTTKYLLCGSGQVAATYMGSGARAFEHINLGAGGESVNLGGEKS